MNKIEISQPAQLDQAISESHNHTVAIFKHSTRCGISKFVLKDFEKGLSSLGEKEIKYYYLDLISHRGISNLVAEKFSVEHESPQLIVLRNGEVVHHSSHSEISTDVLVSE